MYHNNGGIWTGGTVRRVGWSDGPTPEWDDGCSLMVVRAVAITALLCAALWRFFH